MLIGTDERRNGTVRMKDLKTGDQRDVAATSATDWLIERLATEGLRDEP
jgi:histidyl-tRNA synthetase